PQGIDLLLIDIDTDDVVAEVGEAGAGDEPDVARADDCNVQPRGLPSCGLRAPGGPRREIVTCRSPLAVRRCAPAVGRSSRPTANTQRQNIHVVDWTS